MEELILERLEEGIDALLVEAMDEFQKVRDKIHLDKEKAEQLEIKEFDCEEAIRALKNLHYSGRWEKEQHRVVFYNRKIYEYSWFIKNLLVSNTPRSLKDGEIRRCAAIQPKRTNASSPLHGRQGASLLRWLLLRLPFRPGAGMARC